MVFGLSHHSRVRIQEEFSGGTFCIYKKFKQFMTANIKKEIE